MLRSASEVLELVRDLVSVKFDKDATYKDVAKELGIKPWKLYKYKSTGEVPYAVLVPWLDALGVPLDRVFTK